MNKTMSENYAQITIKKVLIEYQIKIDIKVTSFVCGFIGNI